jgi:RecJ-like exonuclease
LATANLPKADGYAMLDAVPCPDCEGVGWTAEHHPKCDGNCNYFGCPYQVQCEKCYGTGKLARHCI